MKVSEKIRRIPLCDHVANEVAALEQELVKCKEDYEHLHQGYTLIKDKWYSPEEVEELSAEEFIDDVWNLALTYMWHDADETCDEYKWAYKNFYEDWHKMIAARRKDGG